MDAVVPLDFTEVDDGSGVVVLVVVLVLVVVVTVMGVATGGVTGPPSIGVCSVGWMVICERLRALCYIFCSLK